jgi:outer membrane protein insertion porin family
VKRTILQFSLFGLLLHILLCSASAEDKVSRIIIKGNKNVTESKIRRVLQIEPGDIYNEANFSAAVKRLYATKEFSDIQAYRSSGEGGIVLEVVVDEYKRVDDVKFEGLKHLKEEDVVKKISMKKGAFVRPSLVSEDKETIVDLYKEKGYFKATVEDTLVKEKEKTVLVYKIDPGNKVSIKHIDFFGNTRLDSDEIRGSMKSKEDRWWRGAEFKPKVLDEDNQKIVDLYRKNGFLDASIEDRELVFSDDSKDLDIFYTIDEGIRYKVGRLKWDGNTIIENKEIAPLITLKHGDVFNDEEFANIQVSISALYWDKGYIYNSVTPVKQIKGDVVDADLEITEGKPAHIHEINIFGNTKTSENVIRRELVIHPGDIFSRPRLIRSLREVFNLGFFAGPPEVSTPPASEEGDIDINLRVKEKQTGQFRLGAGFSALNSLSGFFGISETNFLGRGLQTGINWEFSKYRQNIDLRFTEPWLMGTPTELSFTVYNTNQNQVSQQFYDDRRRGFSIRLGRPFPWFDYTSIYWRYRYELVELKNFAVGYSGPLMEIDWPQRTSSTAITLARNSTDSPFHPRSGTNTLVMAEWNGGSLLGGDAKFQRYEASFSWYTQLFYKFVLEMNVQSGVLDGYNNPNQVPDYELFRLGGNRRYGVRGYDFYEIIPEGNLQYIGGRFMQILSYEISYEIAPTIYGLLFLDSGNTWNSFREADFFDLKKGAGMGIRIFPWARFIEASDKKGHSTEGESDENQSFSGLLDCCICALDFRHFFACSGSENRLH